MDAKNLDQLCVDTIKMLAIDTVQQANSGHPGMPMGAAPMAHVLWHRYLEHDPRNPDWPDRDRFILSAGHGSALLYSLLHLTGYDLPLEDLKRFRQLDSKTPGHPERGMTPGVEATTGPLGQGISMAVGLAIAERHLAARYNRPGFDVVDHFTYVINGDGCLEEGVSYEACSLAGTLGLGRLICLYDDNHITIEGDTKIAFTEDVAKRFEAMGWHVQRVADGHDLAAIDDAIRAAKAETSRPSIICVRTKIADGSPHKEGSAGAHGNPLGPDEVLATKQAAVWPSTEPFFIPGEALAAFRTAVDRGADARARWTASFERYRAAHPELAAELEQNWSGMPPAGWQASLPSFDPMSGQVATRSASGKVLNSIAAALPSLLGGSADLAPSTDTTLDKLGDFGPDDYAGRTLHFGVREHGMAAILNGMAIHGGLRPYGATFLSFADYCRASVRLAALMEAPTTFVFTHDSIGMGEDGPTHQPVEQLTSLRLIPGLTVIRPADATETAGAWAATIENRHGPTVLALTRQKLPVLAQSTEDAVRRVRLGAYILAEASGDPELIIVATGSEVHLALAARERLEERGVPTRVVSMPSWELFDRQPAEYRERVIPADGPYVLAVEAGSSAAWYRYVGPNGDVLGLVRFGASAPYEDVMRAMGFTVEKVVMRALALMERPHLVADHEHHTHTLVGVGAMAHEGHS
jgi:transketolase